MDQIGEPNRLDRVFHFIMKKMIQTGQAPYYTEIASYLGIDPEAGRQALRNLFSSGIAGWLFPNTDYITSFAPFSNLPNQHRITIDGKQKWFGQ